MRHLWTLSALLLVASCDSITPSVEVLAVEAYFEADGPLPRIRLSVSVPLGSEADSPPARGADVRVIIDGERVTYAEEAEPGIYLPVAERIARPGAPFEVRVDHEGHRLRASGRIPPPIRLDSIVVSVPDAPIAAVLLDSLTLALDSLNFELPSTTGYIYPVSVSMWWQAPESSQDSYWVEASATPVEGFTSRLIDFFLLPSSVLEEPSGRALTWSGLYAVPVARETDPMPAHFARVAAIRSTLDYARFALSRDRPDRREPVTNVEGGVGIVAGIAVDSVRVYVE